MEDCVSVIEGRNVLCNHILRSTEEEEIASEASLQTYRALMATLHYVSLSNLPYCDQIEGGLSTYTFFAHLR